MSGKRPGDDLERADEKDPKVLDMKEYVVEEPADVDAEGLRSFHDIMQFARRPYHSHVNSGTLHRAFVLRGILGAKMNGASLLTSEVCVKQLIYVTVFVNPASNLSQKALTISFLFFCQETGSPNMSLEAVLALSADPAVVRIKKNIEGEVPGKFFRNECHYILSRQSGARDTVNCKTEFVPWVPEALRWACPYGHFPGYPNEIPADIEESFVESRENSTISAADLQGWCELIDSATEIPNIYE